MLTEEELIAYLENSLPAAERAAVELELDGNPELRRKLIAQVQLDRALRVSFGGRAAHERVKQSVLAILRAESEECLKRSVLADAMRGNPPAAAKAKGWAGAPGDRLAVALHHLAALFTGWRGAAVAATCVILLVAIIGWRPGREDAGEMEMPSLVQAFGAVLIRAGESVSLSQEYQPHVGDELQLSATSPATVRFSDGTAMHLAPGTRVRLGGDASFARSGGKQITLQAGVLIASVAKQSPRHPMLIHTPHAVATVLGTEFELTVGTDATHLSVSAGAVALARRAGESLVTVRAGQHAVASPGSELIAQAIARNPYQWPFSSASPWNRPLGAGARFEPVTAPAFLADGPLTNAAIPRRIFRGNPFDPLRGVWVNGERVAEVRLADGMTLPPGGDAFALLQPGRRSSLEIYNARTRADGDIEADWISPLDLAGPGAGESPDRARPFGFSALGGLLRAGELERSITHALVARLDKSRLNVRPPGGGVCIWPATNVMRVPPVNGAVAGNVHVGTLLALPPDVDVAKLGLPASMHSVARAMQDFGVYVAGPGPQPFALITEGRPPMADFDAALNRLVPLLQVVANNTALTPGGGGGARRPAAPPLPNEAR